MSADRTVTYEVDVLLDGRWYCVGGRYVSVDEAQTESESYTIQKRIMRVTREPMSPLMRSETW